MKDLYGKPIEPGCRVVVYAHKHHGTGKVIDLPATNQGRVNVRMDATQEIVTISRVDLEVKEAA